MKWLGWKSPEEVAALSKPEPEPTPVVAGTLPTVPVTAISPADYLRIPPVNVKPVHVPKPVEVFPDQTGYYVVQGLKTHRKDN